MRIRLLRRSLVAAGLTTSLLLTPVAVGHASTVAAAPEVLAGCPRTISQGDRGDTVEYLQDLLNTYWDGLGEPNQATDGIFGPVTYARLKKFQDWEGLKADGIAGPQTWKAFGAC
jgi:zinc D-Ala-D-Ala carboxypeptidase